MWCWRFVGISHCCVTVVHMKPYLQNLSHRPNNSLKWVTLLRPHLFYRQGCYLKFPWVTRSGVATPKSIRICCYVSKNEVPVNHPSDSCHLCSMAITKYSESPDTAFAFSSSIAGRRMPVRKGATGNVATEMSSWEDLVGIRCGFREIFPELVVDLNLKNWGGRRIKQGWKHSQLALHDLY
jgi:hypothetical protein